MKKLLFIVAAICCLASCDKDTDPKYTTGPEYGEATYKTTGILPQEEVNVSIPITSAYGLYNVYIIYSLNDKEADVKQVSSHFYQPTDVSIVYTGKIPGQVAGTKVFFQILGITPYSVSGFSKIYEYTVSDTPDPIIPDK